MNRNAIFLIISFVVIFSTCAYFIYPQVKITNTIQCAANPGWTVCEDAKDATYAGILFAVFLQLGIASLVFIVPNDSIPDIPIPDIDS